MQIGKKMITKRALIVLLSLSVLANTLLLYGVVDEAVTLTYRGDEIRYRMGQLTHAEKILTLLLTNVSRANILNLAGKVDLEVLDKGKDEIYVGDIRFVFMQNRVTDVDLGISRGESDLAP